MLNLTAPIELSFVFETIGAICVVIGLCIYLVNLKTKKHISTDNDSKR